MTRAESPSPACSACGEEPERGTITVPIGKITIVLCQECANYAESAIHNKLWQLDQVVPTGDETTSRQVASFVTYPLDLLLDELVDCTVRWNVGPLDADERRIATALLERLATLGIARKMHRVGCEIWPKYRLCSCPWEVPS